MAEKKRRTKGTLNINKQLQKAPGGGSIYSLTSPKNGKGRIITPAPFAMDLLRKQRRRQAEWQLKAGCCFYRQVERPFLWPQTQRCRRGHPLW